MATPAQIQTAIADSQAADVDFGDLALLVKRAILNAMVTSSGEVVLPSVVVSSSGASVSRMSLTEAQALYSKFAALASGGVVPQYVELSS